VDIVVDAFLYAAPFLLATVSASRWRSVPYKASQSSPLRWLCWFMACCLHRHHGDLRTLCACCMAGSPPAARELRGTTEEVKRPLIVSGVICSCSHCLWRWSWCSTGPDSSGLLGLPEFEVTGALTSVGQVTSYVGQFWPGPHWMALLVLAALGAASGCDRPARDRQSSSSQCCRRRGQTIEVWCYAIRVIDYLNLLPKDMSWFYYIDPCADRGSSRCRGLGRVSAGPLETNEQHMTEDVMGTGGVSAGIGVHRVRDPSQHVQHVPG